MSGAKAGILYLMFSAVVLLALPSLVLQYGYSQTTPSGGLISILSSSSFTDDLGYYHVVGESSNR